jgi:hypothetical protein
MRLGTMSVHAEYVALFRSNGALINANDLNLFKSPDLSITEDSHTGRTFIKWLKDTRSKYHKFKIVKVADKAYKPEDPYVVDSVFKNLGLRHEFQFVCKPYQSIKHAEIEGTGPVDVTDKDKLLNVLTYALSRYTPQTFPEETVYATLYNLLLIQFAAFKPTGPLKGWDYYGLEHVKDMEDRDWNFFMPATPLSNWMAEWLAIANPPLTVMEDALDVLRTWGVEWRNEHPLAPYIGVHDPMWSTKSIAAEMEARAHAALCLGLEDIRDRLLQVAGMISYEDTYQKLRDTYPHTYRPRQYICEGGYSADCTLIKNCLVQHYERGITVAKNLKLMA